MGLGSLLKHLVGWPVTGPLYLTRFSMEKARDTAIRELTDESKVKEALMELQLRLQEGEIDEETYEEEEARLMHRLREVRAWRERLGLGRRGGPVRMPRGPGASGPAAEVTLDLGPEDSRGGDGSDDGSEDDT